MVFEYREGDTMLGGRFTAPRSNRFYFVDDPNGGKMEQMEVYHKIHSEKYSYIKRHMFGGYQLLQRLSLAEVTERLEVQKKLWNDMRKQSDQMIHVEFGDFTSIEFFKLFE
jgi:ADP-dependent phosphofructokinase/glucokinase